MALAFDDLGVSHGERVAIVSPNSGRFLTSYFGVSGYGRVLVPINFRLTADEIAYIVEHSGASVLLYDPDVTDEVDTIKVSHRFCLDGVEDAALFAPAPDGVAPQPVAGRRGRQLLGELHVGHDGPAQGRAAHPAQLLAERGDVRVAHRRQRPRRAAAHAPHVPLQRLGHAVCGDRHGWHPRRAAQGGRRGDPLARRASRRHAALRCARRGRGRPGGSRGPGGRRTARARTGHRAHRRRRRAAALQDDRAGGVRAGLGVHPDLRAHRDRPAADHQPGAGRVGRSRSRGAIGVARLVPVCPPSACRSTSTPTARSWPAPTTCSPAIGSSRRESAEALDGGWFHTGDGGYLDGAYVVISDRKKDVIITGGENVSSIEVEDCLYQHPAVAEVAVIGVPDEKWGETIKALVVVREGHDVSEAELIAHCRERLAHFKAPTSVEMRDALDRTATGKLQKYKLRQPYWTAGSASSTSPGRLRSPGLCPGTGPARALLEDEVAAAVERGGDVAGDEPAQRVCRRWRGAIPYRAGSARRREAAQCPPAWRAAPGRS